MERVAPIMENKMLQSSVASLEKSLTGAHADNDRMRGHLACIGSQNLDLTIQLGEIQAELAVVGTGLANTAEEKNGERSIHPIPSLQVPSSG